MSREDREYYIAALVLHYPNKAESYFHGMTDAEIEEEYRIMQERV